MYLTLTYKVVDAKNSGHQGKARRSASRDSRAPAKESRFAERITGLSHRKNAILLETATRFSEAYQDVVQWGLNHFDEIPFRYPLIKDGQPIVDKHGNQKYGLCDAHYLANWLSGRVVIAGLHSKLKNGVRNQAAETLLSQFRLRETAEATPGRLTGPEVGLVKERRFREAGIQEEYEAALTVLNNPVHSEKEWQEVEAAMRVAPEPRLLPILFSGPQDFLLFRHKETGRTFVCIPLLERESENATRSVVQKGVDNLEPLRQDGPSHLPNSKQWVLLPLLHQRSNLPNQRNGDELLVDPLVRLLTAELRHKDGAWYFNIIIDVPEPESFEPERWLGIHQGYYKTVWALVERAQVVQEGEYDLTHISQIVEASAKERDYARDNCRRDRFPNYKKILQRERERIANELVVMAVEYRAAIGVEDISGVNKATPSRRVNLMRSHWDFGRFVEVLTYKSALAGLPMRKGRGGKKNLFAVYSPVAAFTCSVCGASNAGKAEKERPVKREEGVMVCVCGARLNADTNAARVIAIKAREFWAKK